MDKRYPFEITRIMNAEERAQFVADIAEAIHDSMPSPLTAEETAAVRLLIVKETQRIDFRKAVIEKTSIALLIAMCLFAGSTLWAAVREYAISHWGKS